MKILSAEQIRLVDQFTIDQQNILSHDLMERAASSCCNWLEERVNKEQRIAIFCGPGNNGGDGLAIARILIKSGYQIKVFILGIFQNRSEDFEKNLKLLEETDSSTISVINTIDDFPFVTGEMLLIDALFGTGLSRPIDGLAGRLISYLNDSGAKIISIDIPSGLYTDSIPEKDAHIIQATDTLSFQLPKFSFLFPGTGKYVGEWHLLDIGLDRKFITGLSTKRYYTSITDCKNILKPRPKYSHKGTFGHALLISGSKGKMGAAVIAASACLRSGVGLLTVHSPSAGADILQITVPEAMLSEETGEAFIKTIPDLNPYTAIGIGPGCGTGEEFSFVLKEIISNVTCPLVLDADAINCLSNHPGLLEKVPQNTILTPHIKEFDRLAGNPLNDAERHKRQVAFSVKYKVLVVLKGAHTCISAPDGSVYFNSTGNPGMAKGGSGDALTGVILALLAQGYSSLDASRLAVFVHGTAGDIAKEKFTEYSMTSVDLVAGLGDAFKMILHHEL